MKKIILLSWLFLPGALSAETLARMTTFFPTPYVAYSRVGGKSLLVGTTYGSPKLTLGTSALTTTGEIFKIPNYGALKLQKGTLNLIGKNAEAAAPLYNVNIAGAVTLGTAANGGLAQLFFGNLRVEQESNSLKAASVQAASAIIGELKLFGKVFPSCAAKFGSNVQGQISWESVQLSGAASAYNYLVCEQRTN
ncbi:MAG: hypothetical protein J6V32_06295 [Elusimicrobiaceae bacterium]|nr:hypothetical protein [Elusimicrobiaceae bacterium]